MATMQPSRSNRDHDFAIRAARRATVDEHERTSRAEFRASLVTFAILVAGLAFITTLATLN